MKRNIDWSLYLVTDEMLSKPRTIDEVVRLAVQGGVTAVQLREKNSSTRQFIERAQQLLEFLKPFRIPLIINDRVDVALAVNADGVHIGQSDMPYELTRRLLGSEKIIGLSVETIEQVREAEHLDVDYLGVSPVFATPTKTDVLTQWGLEGLKKLRAITNKKLVAIGGINRTNAAEVIRAGADGIAVVSAICSAEKPEEAARELKTIIQQERKKL